MGNYYAYMRISTAEERGLQKYNSQEKAINKYANENNVEYVLKFKEDKSGKNFAERDQWRKLAKIVKKNDTIVFKDLSRFTRETENGYNKYMELMNKGIELVFIDNPTVSTAYIKNMLDIAESQNIVARASLEGTIKVLLIAELDRAEKERITLSQRIKDGIAAGKAGGTKKKGKIYKLDKNIEYELELYNKREKTLIEIQKTTGISRNTLAKYAKILREEKKNE